MKSFLFERAIKINFWLQNASVIPGFFSGIRPTIGSLANGIRIACNWTQWILGMRQAAHTHAHIHTYTHIHEHEASCTAKHSGNKRPVFLSGRNHHQLSLMLFFSVPNGHESTVRELTFYDQIQIYCFLRSKKNCQKQWILSRFRHQQCIFSLIVCCFICNAHGSNWMFGVTKKKRAHPICLPRRKQRFYRWCCCTISIATQTHIHLWFLPVVFFFLSGTLEEFFFCCFCCCCFVMFY